MRVAFAKAKATHIFLSENNSEYAVSNDQSSNDTLTNDIISFEQVGPGLVANCRPWSAQMFWHIEFASTQFAHVCLSKSLR